MPFFPFFSIRFRAPIKVLLTILLLPCMLPAQSYPDQQRTRYAREIIGRVESVSGIKINADSTALVLEDGYLHGSLVMQVDSSLYPFNRGLPSWNGHVEADGSSFIIQIRFPYLYNWSPWLTAGYWQEYNWSPYGTVSYGGGEVDYDYVLLDDYQSAWQYTINLKRAALTDPSPTLSKISFFASDTRTTDSMDFAALLNDNPPAIFIDTDFYYQYDLDPEIGGDICSPTSVSMVLRSYGIDVDPVEFANGTYDPYWHIFGMWPRVVQHAAEYGLDGTVTRYRNWSDAQAILAAGGRIVMSVGPPLYSGHLMMLAGFTESGQPIVHDPAKRDGYGKVYNKNDLAHSWFDKGGISYTFFPADSITVSLKDVPVYAQQPQFFHLEQNYPNPFNPQTTIPYTLQRPAVVTLEVFNLLGQRVARLVDTYQEPGHYQYRFDGNNLPSGVYFVRLQVNEKVQAMRIQLVR